MTTENSSLPSQEYAASCLFDQINTALVTKRDFFQLKNKKS